MEVGPNKNKNKNENENKNKRSRSSKSSRQSGGISDRQTRKQENKPAQDKIYDERITRQHKTGQDRGEGGGGARDRNQAKQRRNINKRREEALRQQTNKIKTITRRDNDKKWK